MLFNYEDFSFKTNSNTYIGIGAMLLVIISMLMSNRNERKYTDS